MKKLVCLLAFIGFSAYAENISLALKNAPTADVIIYLAEENGKNVVLPDTLSQTATLRLENRNFDQIIHTLARVNNLTVTQDKAVYFIQPAKEEAPQELQKMPDLATEIKPKLVTRSVKLDYAKASEVIQALTKGNGNVLSENGYLHFDERSNRLIIKDNPNSLKHILALIKELDQPTEQIAIEARIVTISSENLQELGVRWGVFSPNGNHHHFAGKLEANGADVRNLNVNFPVSNAASAVLQIATINSRVLDLELTALERENSVEIIASPRLLTTNKQKASIKQGTEIPYAFYSKKDEIEEIVFKEAVLGLEVTPHLSKNRQILLDLVVSQNSPNSQTSNNSLISIDKQEINTQVFAKHGETIVLGGVFQHLAAKGEDKVPIFGSIPVIKYLFSQSRDRISKRELVIFVTPYIISPPEKAAKKEKQN